MRDHYLDTSKAVLIFLVVFGHFLERLVGWQFETSGTLLSLIYLIHMPAFIFISGMLFKDLNYFKNILFFLSLYLPFQLIYPLFEALLSGQIRLNGFNLFERPYWILWYLLGMMAWTALTHILIKTKFPVWIALGLSLLIGFSPWNNYNYSIGRILVFLPFFVAGAVYGKAWIMVIKKQRFLPLIGIGILFLILGLFIKIDLSQYWFYGSLSYQQLKVEPWLGVGLRLLCIGLASLGIYALLGVIKQLGNRWTALGTYTLPVYLLHGLVVMGVAHIMKIYASALNLSPFNMILLSLFLAITTCAILQLKVFDQGLRLLSQWLMTPYLKLTSKR